MTVADIRTQARVYARLSASGLTDAQCITIIDQAHQEVCADINGVTKRATVAIGEKFFLGAELFIRVTVTGGANALVATDIQVTATTLNGASGATVAAGLQVLLRAAGSALATVAWTSFYFTVGAPGATSIKIEAPTGVTHGNATNALFGSATATQTGVTWTGSFPRDCTIEANLPNDFHSMTFVTWNNIKINEAPRYFFCDPKISGTFPYYYFIRGDKLQFFPTPTVQYLCNIWYQSVPVSGYLATDTMTPVLPDRYHTLVLYYTTHLFLMATHEPEKAAFWFKRYNKEKNQFIVNQANQITEPSSAAQAIPWFSVRTT
jgi:hypothetical protein